ncbi:helix-turn-helix domain-containing protein [Lactobacillus sp. AN1001]
MRKFTTGDRLHYLMDARGLKQVDILRETKPLQKKYNIKLSKSTLSQYVNNIQSPDQDRLYLLSKTLNVSEPWLMGFDVPQERDDNKIGKDDRVKKINSSSGKVTTKLTELRKRADLSQTKLAKVLGIDVDTLNMYEIGQQEPTLGTIIEMANYFDVTTDFLLGRTTETIKENINNEINLLFDDISHHIKHLTQLDREVIHKLAEVYLNNKEKISLDFE